jgi:hypothetical protein
MNDGIFDFRFAICDLKKRWGFSSRSQITDWHRRNAGQVAHCRSIENRKSKIKNP